ncbi:MAG: HEPN domain-containing protein [Deltaproteobacteria bacterium]
MTKKKLFKKEYSVELLKIAEGDLETAKGLIKVKMGRRENILFHLEQVVEKSLTAVLCAKGIALPFTHELGIILELFPSGLEVPQSDDMVDLGQFASVRRYEEGVAEITDEEIQETLTLAMQTLAWAKKQ